MGRLDRLAAGFELLWRAVRRHGTAAVVGNQVKIALHVADQEIEPAGSSPVHGEDGGGGAQVDIFPVALQFHWRGEFALPLALEEVQIDRKAASEDVADAVAIEVH